MQSFLSIYDNCEKHCRFHPLVVSSAFNLLTLTSYYVMIQNRERINRVCSVYS